MAEQGTRFGSLSDYSPGRVSVIKDDPRNYAYSNVFAVAAAARPYEKVAVAKNAEYVLEAVRAQGRSPWRIARHDEFILVMDGEVEVRFIQPDDQSLVPSADGSVTLSGRPDGSVAGRVRPFQPAGIIVAHQKDPLARPGGGKGPGPIAFWRPAH